MSYENYYRDSDDHHNLPNYHLEGGHKNSVTIINVAIIIMKIMMQSR